MARRGRHAAASEARTTLKIIGVCAVILAFVAGAVYLWSQVKDPVNTKTLCPKDGPVGHTVLLVDKSDPLTFTQSKEFSVLYREVVTKQIKKGYLLSVYALTDEFKDTAEPLLELCNPGNGSDIDPLTGGKQLAKKLYDEKYVRALLELAPSLVAENPGKASPIMEMIQLAGITGFRRKDVKGPRRLIVV